MMKNITHGLIMKKNSKPLIEKAATEDAPHIASLLSWAFGFSRARSDEYIANVGLDTMWVLRAGGADLDACAALLPTTHVFSGKPVRTANIAHVAIAPESRGKGLAIPFVEALCDEAQQSGAAMVTLFASTRPVYRKSGFELAGHEIIYEAETACLPYRSKLSFDRVRLDDPIIVKAYASRTHREAGLLARSKSHWNELLRKPTDALAAYVAGGENPVAYLILDMSDKHGLTVRDWHAGSLDASEGILSFLARFRSVFQTVRWHGGPQDDLVAAMPDKGWRLAHQEEWLARILDPAEALRQRGYHIDNAKLALVINDGQSSLALQIEVQSGQISVRGIADDLGPHVAMPASSFAQIFTGFRSASKLAQYGKVSGSSADVRLCDQLFAGPLPWVAEHF